MPQSKDQKTITRIRAYKLSTIFITTTQNLFNNFAQLDEIKSQKK